MYESCPHGGFAEPLLAETRFEVREADKEFRPWLMANPLTFIIEQAREVLIWGRQPNWLGLGTYTLAAVAIAWAGYAGFQKTRKGFADVRYRCCNQWLGREMLRAHQSF